jgi:hypothetical protein
MQSPPLLAQGRQRTLKLSRDGGEFASAKAKALA